MIDDGFGCSRPKQNGMFQKERERNDLCKFMCPDAHITDKGDLICEIDGLQKVAHEDACPFDGMEHINSSNSRNSSSGTERGMCDVAAENANHRLAPEPKSILGIKAEEARRDTIRQARQDGAAPIEPPPSIHDSGTRRQFASGAVRDMSVGKGDMVSIPWESVLRLSRHYENGARKYDRWNFRKGINLSSYIDSACRHLAKYQCGCDDEDHLAAAAFNVLGAMLVEELNPELIDLPMRKGKNRFTYFGGLNG